MNTEYQVFWGIDVSKDWLDISIDGQVTRVNQIKKDIVQFIKRHKTLEQTTLAVVESTGVMSYWLPLPCGNDGSLSGEFQ